MQQLSSVGGEKFVHFVKSERYVDGKVFPTNLNAYKWKHEMKLVQITALFVLVLRWGPWPLKGPHSVCQEFVKFVAQNDVLFLLFYFIIVFRKKKQ